LDAGANSFVTASGVFFFINGVEPSCSNTNMLLIHASSQEDKAANREALHKCAETLASKKLGFTKK
jgi:hypothetical protein